MSLHIATSQSHHPLNRRKVTKAPAQVNPAARIFNMDATEFLCGLAENSVDLILTSPPYNMGSRSDRIDGRRKAGGYDPKSYGGIQGYFDSLPEDEYQDQQVSILKAAAKALKLDGVLVYNHKPRRRNGEMIHPMAWLGRVNDLTLMEEVIWDRGSTHNHSNKLLWPHTERLYVFRRTDGIYRLNNTDRLTFRSDIWKVPLTSRPADGHAAPFPLPLAEAAVSTFANPGDMVCDPYSGSGTTAVAAVRNGCEFVGSEIDKAYHAASVRRVNAEMRAGTRRAA